MDNSRSALIVVDVQNDFCPGGALPVPDGDKVVEPLNSMIECAPKNGWPVIASRDWHPRETRHFAEFGGTWPVHCAQDTPGARFHPELKLPPQTIIVSKGTGDEDAYSAFDGDTPATVVGAVTCEQIALEEVLRRLGVKIVFVGGLATDYCVKATAIDARRCGFETYLLLDACRAVNLKPNDGDRAVEEMRRVGVIITSTDEIIGEFSR